MIIPGRRLRGFADEWRACWAQPQVMEWITSGYHIKIRKDQPISLKYPTKRDETKIDCADHHLLVKTEVAAMLQKGAIRVVTNNKLGYYSKLFLVPKSTVDGVKKWRPCINLKPLNNHVHKDTFNSESVKTTRGEVQPNDWAASIDMTDIHIFIFLK